jgi:hypothetical protein
MPVMSVQTVVERYRRNLRATQSTNVDEARRKLSLVVEKILLRCEGEAPRGPKSPATSREFFVLEPDVCASVGAGRRISYLPHWPVSTWRSRASSTAGQSRA